MSQSFSEPAEHSTAEPDVGADEDQVEPDDDSQYVGRVAGDDEGFSGEQGSEARAVSYIQVKTARGHSLFGAGIDTNIELASIKAVVSALNRAMAKK